MPTIIEDALNPQTLVPINVSHIDPVIRPAKIGTLFAHPGTKTVPTGDNKYVEALLNSGWRWDTPGNGINWNVQGTFQVPLDTKGIPPITTLPTWLTGLQNAVQYAMDQWASVADIHPQFSATNDQIVAHVVPLASYDFGYGGYAGTPFDAATSSSSVLGPVLYKNLTIAENGIAHVYISDHAVGEPPLKPPTWQVDAQGNVSITEAGKEMFVHEIGHALGLKHPFDTGASGSNSTFPGVDPTAPDASSEFGDNNLNSKFGSVMSYNFANPQSTLPFGGAPGGAVVTPMAFDIAAIQTLYGANTNNHGGNDTYTLSDPGSPEGQSWQCIWDTGGTDQIVYNGKANAVIDLRPATLDNSTTGAGMGSYTYDHTSVSRGGTIAGDITNAIPDVNGMTGVIIENAQGGSGDDLITGNDANNVLQGGAGNDVISALAGNDIINGNEGNDTMTGGAGSDVFIFDPGSGHDTIPDFTIGQDLLDVADLGINDPSSFGFIQMAQVGADAHLSINTFAGPSQIDLLGINAATLGIGDFRFV